VLLVATGLIGRSLVAVRQLDLGFDPSHVLTFGVDQARLPRYRDLSESQKFFEDFTAALHGSPSIETAGVGAVPLFTDYADTFRIDQLDTAVESNVNVPGGDYFRALRIPLVAGRLLQDTDDKKGERVAVVNQAFARRVWGDTTRALGQRVRYDMKDAP